MIQIGSKVAWVGDVAIGEQGCPMGYVIAESDGHTMSDYEMPGPPPPNMRPGDDYRTAPAWQILFMDGVDEDADNWVWKDDSYLVEVFGMIRNFNETEHLTVYGHFEMCGHIFVEDFATHPYGLGASENRAGQKSDVCMNVIEDISRRDYNAAFLNASVDELEHADAIATLDELRERYPIEMYEEPAETAKDGVSDPTSDVAPGEETNPYIRARDALAAVMDDLMDMFPDPAERAPHTHARVDRIVADLNIAYMWVNSIAKQGE